jgi:DNA-binding winged helix-turn-helix (wHTH) protein
MIELNFPNAVRDEKDFYGRKMELERIERVLLSGRRVPILIIGERRIGKTSLQNVVLRRLQSVEEPRFVSLNIEPRGITSLDDFAKAILQRLCSYVGKKMQDTGLVDSNGKFHYEGVEQVEWAINGLLDSRANQIFLLCVDEFDEIIRNVQEINLLEALVHRLIEGTPLAILFTMTLLPSSIQKMQSTPFTTIAEIVSLKTFEENEMAEMILGILGDQVAVSQNEISLLFSSSGGHPYFAKLLLANIYERNNMVNDPQAITDLMVNQAIQDAANDLRTDTVLENLYHIHFSEMEKELLLLLAEKEKPISCEDLKIVGTPWLTAARQLVKRHYLIEDENHVDFRINFFRNWLRNWVEFSEECERRPFLRARLAEPVEIEVNEKLGQVYVRGQAVMLSSQEYRIMLCLAGSAGKLVKREYLVAEVWGVGSGVSDEMVDTAFYRLRKKLHDSGQYLETNKPGHGFVLHRTVLHPRDEARGKNQQPEDKE